MPGIHHGASDAQTCVQAQLSRRLPLCLATLLGTHNSGITIADGYGNRDEYFQEYFKWIRWVVSALVDSVLNTSVSSLYSAAAMMGKRSWQRPTHPPKHPPKPCS